MDINFNNKTFALIQNSQAGTASEQTILYFSQTDDIISATYKGGNIINGHIIAFKKGPKMNMRYHCITSKHELKAGTAIAMISKSVIDKIQLDLNWKWLDGDEAFGTSTYQEI